MLLKSIRGLFNKLQLNLAKHFEKAAQRELCLKNQLADMAKQFVESGNIYPWANHLDIENFRSIKQDMNIFHFIESLCSATLPKQYYLELTRVTMPKVIKQQVTET